MKTLTIAIVFLLSAICLQAQSCQYGTFGSSQFANPPSASQVTTYSQALPAQNTLVPPSYNVGYAATCTAGPYSGSPIVAQIDFVVGCPNTNSVFMWAGYQWINDRLHHSYWLYSDGYAKAIDQYGNTYYQAQYDLRSDCTCFYSNGAGYFATNYSGAC